MKDVVFILAMGLLVAYFAIAVGVGLSWPLWATFLLAN